MGGGSGGLPGKQTAIVAGKNLFGEWGSANEGAKKALRGMGRLMWTFLGKKGEA